MNTTTQRTAHSETEARPSAYDRDDNDLSPAAAGRALLGLAARLTHSTLEREANERAKARLHRFDTVVRPFGLAVPASFLPSFHPTRAYRAESANARHVH